MPTTYVFIDSSLKKVFFFCCYLALCPLYNLRDAYGYLEPNSSCLNGGTCIGPDTCVVSCIFRGPISFSKNITMPYFCSVPLGGMVVIVKARYAQRHASMEIVRDPIRVFVIQHYGTVPIVIYLFAVLHVKTVVTAAHLVCVIVIQHLGTVHDVKYRSAMQHV